jgi:hypothetical protein
MTAAAISVGDARARVPARVVADGPYLALEYAAAPRAGVLAGRTALAVERAPAAGTRGLARGSGEALDVAAALVAGRRARAGRLARASGVGGARRTASGKGGSVARVASRVDRAGGDDLRVVEGGGALHVVARGDGGGARLLGPGLRAGRAFPLEVGARARRRFRSGRQSRTRARRQRCDRRQHPGHPTRPGPPGFSRLHSPV